MLQVIKKHILSAIKKQLVRLCNESNDEFAIKSYSQEGEDMIMRRIFESQSCGFFVDVGAHHPYRFSNTYFFYKRGWNGINIEPNPDAIKIFRNERPRDINLQTAISDVPGNLTYHIFDEPALNTFDAALAQSRVIETAYQLLQKTEVPVERLDSVLDASLPEGTAIDFLSIDAEGLDLQVLRSNNWDKYRPQCVLVEALETDLEGAMSGELHRFMVSRHYALFAKTYNTLFYKDSFTAGTVRR